MRALGDASDLAILVDADAWTLRAMGRVLTDLDFRVLEVSAPSVGLVIALGRRADVVVYDDACTRGLAFAEKIRATWDHDAPGLVALARGGADVGSADGGDVVLHKPIGAAELVDAVERAISASRARRRAARHGDR